MNPLIKSLEFEQNIILDSIEKLYLPNGFDVDLTYGNGSFYKNRKQPSVKLDLQPLFPDVIQANSTQLPLKDNSFNSIMFDPPFLTYVKSAREHTSKSGKKSIMASRFGGYWKYSELVDHYFRTIQESFRILKPKGFLVIKCQDIIHNHSFHCTHQLVMNYANLIGFNSVDLFVLGAKHRINIKKTQKHSRIFHSYFLVFQK